MGKRFSLGVAMDAVKFKDDKIYMKFLHLLFRKRKIILVIFIGILQ